MVIMASSQGDERSWARGTCSIFTESLIEAFKAEHLKRKHFLVDEYVRTVETANYVFERTPEKFLEMKKTDINQVMRENMQMPYANLQMSSDFVICYIPEELKPKISTKNLLTQPQKVNLLFQKASILKLGKDHPAIIYCYLFMVFRVNLKIRLEISQQCCNPIQILMVGP